MFSIRHQGTLLLFLKRLKNKWKHNLLLCVVFQIFLSFLFLKPDTVIFFGFKNGIYHIISQSFRKSTWYMLVNERRFMFATRKENNKCNWASRNKLQTTFLIWVIRHVHTYIELKYNLNWYPILNIIYFSADLKKKLIITFCRKSDMHVDKI